MVMPNEVPVTVIEEMARRPVPVLVSVTGIVAVVPAFTFPKLTGEGARETPGATPAPEIAMVCGLPATFVLTVN